MSISKKQEVNYPPLLKSITEELVVQELENELLIYNLKTNRAICLNRTAALVWQSCDGKSDISEITQKLEEELGASVNEELVLFAVSELNNKGLIENGEKIADSFRGLSRREIVRRVGFASLVTLPIVSSIVAPKASFAQTLRLRIDPNNCRPTGEVLQYSAANGHPTRQSAENFLQSICDEIVRDRARTSRTCCSGMGAILGCRWNPNDPRVRTTHMTSLGNCRCTCAA